VLELKIPERSPSTLRNIDSGPREVPELKIPERPPSTLRNVDGGPQEVPELKIRERPPSTLRKINGGPPGGAEARDLGAQHLRSMPLGQGGKWLQKPRDKCSKSS
jgi:hypothetical protein